MKCALDLKTKVLKTAPSRWNALKKPGQLAGTPWGHDSCSTNPRSQPFAQVLDEREPEALHQNAGSLCVCIYIYIYLSLSLSLSLSFLSAGLKGHE